MLASGAVVLACSAPLLRPLPPAFLITLLPLPPLGGLVQALYRTLLAVVAFLIGIKALGKWRCIGHQQMEQGGRNHTILAASFSPRPQPGLPPSFTPAVISRLQWSLML